jgi:hypothetical protein
MLVAPSNRFDDCHGCPCITVPSLEEVPVPTLRQTAAIVLAVLTLTLTMVACSSPAATPDPTADLTPTPDSTATAGAYTDAEQADILAENIDRTYAEDTRYTWYPAFVELTVEDGSANVRTTLTEADADLANSMCRDIAAVAFENFIEPIGVTDVQIFGNEGDDFVDCDVPER